MMKSQRSFLIIYLLLTGFAAFSQAPVWLSLKRMGGSTSSMVGLTTVSDPAGNCYSAGWFEGSVDMDPNVGVSVLTAVGSSDIYVCKTSPTGDLIWAKAMGASNYDAAVSIALDTAQNVCITGYFNGTIDLDPGAGVDSHVSSGADVFTVKLDMNGNYLWGAVTGGPYFDSAGDIAVDAAGNIYVTGRFLGTVDFDPHAGTASMTSAGGTPNEDVFILKLDAAGNYLWSKRVGAAANDAVFSISVDAGGNVYAIGAYSGTTDFDPGAGLFFLYPTNAADVFIWKLDSAGNLIFAKDIGGAYSTTENYAYPTTIAVDTSENIYITGTFLGTVDFDPGAGIYNLSSPAYSNIFTAKYTATCDLSWVTTFGCVTNDHSNDLVLDAQGNIYTTGFVEYDADFDPGSGSHVLIGGGTFLMKQDNAGNFQGAGISAHADKGNAVALDGLGNIYVVGQFSNSYITFGPYTVNNTSSSGKLNLFIAKGYFNSIVWPGDTDNDGLVSAADLLPVGLHYGQTGIPRDSVSNLWQGNPADNWGLLQSSGIDLKHADCNGDGSVDDNDTLAIGMNFTLSHLLLPSGSQNTSRLIDPEFHFVTSSSSYEAGDWVDVEIWAGNASMPVTSLYGIAFEIDYDASLIEAGTESLAFPASWLATPGTDGLKVGAIDAPVNKVQAAITRMTHTNASGYGKIANFKFRIDPLLADSSGMTLSLSGYQANGASGTPVTFTSTDKYIGIGTPLSVRIRDNEPENKVIVYPNPFSQNTRISLNAQVSNASLIVYNAIGARVRETRFSGKSVVLNRFELPPGIYHYQVVEREKEIASGKLMIVE